MANPCRQVSIRRSLYPTRVDRNDRTRSAKFWSGGIRGTEPRVKSRGKAHNEQCENSEVAVDDWPDLARAIEQAKSLFKAVVESARTVEGARP
jgi:hypothetical protein